MSAETRYDYGYGHGSGGRSGGGWIGDWSPGIGDPSFFGWFTVFVYFAIAWRAAGLVRKAKASFFGAERWFWPALTALLVALGINKQLDLQTALTELGRLLAHEQGWYESRAQVQRWFVLLVAAGGLGALGLLGYALRRTPRATQLTLLGTLGLLGFVLVRAASIHRVDAFIGSTAGGLRWNWLLELGSLFVVALGVRLRLKALTGRPRAERAAPRPAPRRAR